MTMTNDKIQMLVGASSAPSNYQERDDRAKRHLHLSFVHWSFVIAVTLVCGVTALGCGRRAAPVVPRTAPPEPVADLSAAPQANTILLTWSRPARYEDGTPLRGVPEFRLFRRSAPLPAGASAADAQRDLEGFTLLATVRGEVPDDRHGWLTLVPQGAAVAGR